MDTVNQPGPADGLARPLCIVLAPDSYKESLTAAEVCVAMEAGLKVAFPEAEFVHVPMADGGEGTCASLVDARGGSIERVRVTGPLGRPVDADLGLLPGGVGVVEMASASGLALVPPAERDPRVTTTRGTGELVRAALDRGVRSLILAIGGSATNDAGAGLAQALGVRLLDADASDLPDGGAALARLDRIDVSDADPRLAALAIQVACDVDNPLCGPVGASAVYGPQKGATPAIVAELDAALAHFADVVRRDLGRDIAAIPGAGAAGGLGGGLLAFTNAELRRGVRIVIDETRLADAVARADLVVTGEGRVDAQTRHGKTPFGVAEVARAAGVPVVAVAGCLGDGADELGDVFDVIVPVLDRLDPPASVLAAGASNVERACRELGRTLRLGGLLAGRAG
jgi:glycerate 2-kinase